MTEKLYYSDGYCREFSAVVSDCACAENGYIVTLDKTAFYPEGGGQPADHGTLHYMDEDGNPAETRVFDVHEKNGRIDHYTNRPISIGTPITGVIDWERRFDLMQNHSGEHIVSGLVHQTYGYENVGFHMGSDVITIDFDGELTQEQLREIERRANQAVWANKPVQIHIYEEHELEDLVYRSKKELHGEVRIVTFPEADVCACCGTHVGYTGEIGLIKLISVQKFRSGVRVELVSGSRALLYVDEICRQNHAISVALSAKPMETAEAAVRLKESAAKTAFRAVALENELFRRKAESLKKCGNILLFEDELSPDSVRKLAVTVMESCEGRCAVFSGDDENGYKYALGEKNGDLRELVKKINAALNGKGGGKPFFVQGNVKAVRSSIEALLQAEGFRKCE